MKTIINPKYLSDLQKITLEEASQITDLKLTHIHLESVSVEGFSNLKILNLSDNFLTEISLDAVSKQNLTDLNLSFNRLSDKLLLSELKNFPNLNNLLLGNNQFKLSLKEFVGWNLQSLDLSNSSDSTKFTKLSLTDIDDETIALVKKTVNNFSFSPADIISSDSESDVESETPLNNVYEEEVGNKSDFDYVISNKWTFVTIFIAIFTLICFFIYKKKSYKKKNSNTYRWDWRLKRFVKKY